MCTVTLSPRGRGYALAMNRDEKLARAAALPPAKRHLDGRAVVCPSEAGGGTWVSLNDSGVSFALINWYSIPARAMAGAISRGEVVRAVSAFDSADSATDALHGLPLNQIGPFRLIGIFPATRGVIQWQWDLRKLVRKRHQWRIQQWISSGFDEPAARRERGRTFRRFLRQKTAGSAGWLRRLHVSHAPEAGPFSICMHRADAATVSYTEVSVSPGKAVLRYYDGAPCRGLDKNRGRMNLLQHCHNAPIEFD
jgi:hypothetical protein